MMLMNRALLSGALALAILLPAMSQGQPTLSTLRALHFEVRYYRGVQEEEAQRVLQLLQSDEDSLKHQLGIEMRDKVEVRLHDSPGRYHAELNTVKDVPPVMNARGTLHVLATASARHRDELLRYELAKVFLEKPAGHGCPGWLCEAYAVYHSGRMTNLSTPPVSYTSFSDLTQDMQSARSAGEMAGLEYVLGRTMQFFIERFGEEKAFGLFKAFTGEGALDTVFKKVLGSGFQDIEKSWSAYVAVKPGRHK